MFPVARGDDGEIGDDGEMILESCAYLSIATIATLRTTMLPVMVRYVAPIHPFYRREFLDYDI